jgi:hypothetical protein
MEEALAALTFVPMTAATSLEVLPLAFGVIRDTPSSSPWGEGLTKGFLSANMSSISFATLGDDCLLSLSDSAFLLAFFLPIERDLEFFSGSMPIARPRRRPRAADQRGKDQRRIFLRFFTHRSCHTAMAATTLTTPQMEQYAAVLTRYPLFEPVDQDEEWDNEFYESRRKIPPSPFPLQPRLRSRPVLRILLCLFADALVEYEKRVLNKRKPVGKDGKVEYFVPVNIAPVSHKYGLRVKTGVTKVHGVRYTSPPFPMFPTRSSLLTS